MAELSKEAGRAAVPWFCFWSDVLWTQIRMDRSPELFALPVAFILASQKACKIFCSWSYRSIFNKAAAVEPLVKPLEWNSCGQRQAEPIFRMLCGAKSTTNSFLPLLEMPWFVKQRTASSILTLQAVRNLGLFMNPRGRITHLKAYFSSSTHLFLSWNNIPTLVLVLRVGTPS